MTPLTSRSTQIMFQLKKAAVCRVHAPNIFAFDISPTKIMCFDAHKFGMYTCLPKMSSLFRARHHPIRPDRFLKARLKGCPVAGQGFCGPSSASLVLTSPCVPCKKYCDRVTELPQARFRPTPSRHFSSFKGMPKYTCHCHGGHFNVTWIQYVR